MHPPSETPSSFPPWWQSPTLLVLAGGLVMGLALGIRHVQGLFLLPISMERGWSREVFGLAMAVQNLGWGLMQPLTGMAADRWGARRVVAAGLPLYALGLWGMARATTPSAFVLAGGLCIGLALACTTFGVVYGALSRLSTPQGRGRMLGLAGAAGGLGQFVLVPGAQALLSSVGWVTALLVLGVALLLALPAAWALDDRRVLAATGPGSQPLGEALREAFGHRGFLLLNVGFLACGFQLAFIATHLPAWLLDQGLRATDGMVALALIALANVAGTWYFGAAGARWSKKKLLAGVYLARTAAIALFLLLPLSAPSLYAFALAMGFLWLGTVPLTSGLLSQIFGLRYVATLFGFVFFGHQLGAFLGVWLGGWVFEATRSYQPVWLLAMLLGVLAALLHWPIDERSLPRGQPVPDS